MVLLLSPTLHCYDLTMAKGLAVGVLAGLLGGRLYLANRALGGRSSFFFGRTEDQVRALSAQVGVPLERFLIGAQRILWGVLQSDLIRVDLPSACAQLTAQHPDFFVTHLVVAFCKRSTGQAAEADAALARARALLPAGHPLSYLMPTEPEWACAAPEGTLTELVAGSIWRCPGYYSYPQCPFHQFMHATIIGRRNGTLMLLNPVSLSPASIAAVRALGEVTHIVAPVKFHNRFIGEAQSLFPNAKTFGVPGHRVNPPSAHLRFDGFLDDAQPLFGEELQQVHIAGHQFEETAFFHPASRTVILHDLLLANLAGVPGSTFWLRLYAFVWGVHDEVALASYQPMMWTDIYALRRSLTKILAWDADRVFMCHAPDAAIPTGGREVLRKALGWASQLGAAEYLLLAGGFFRRQPGFLRDLIRYMVNQR